MSRRAPNPKYDWLYAVGALIAIGAFGSIPFFLSRVEMAPPLQAAPVVDTRPAVPVLGGTLVFRDADAMPGWDSSLRTDTPETPATRAAAKEASPAADAVR